MNLYQFVILGMAVWRISSLFVREEGPGRIFERIREKVGIAHNENGVQIAIADGYLPSIFSCVWCFSINFSFVCYASYILFPNMTLMVLTPFAIGALAVIIHERN